MPTKYIAKLHGVIVGKRTTQSRTYTHAVVVLEDVEADRKAAYGYVATKHDRENFNYQTEVATAGLDHEHMRWCTEAQRIERLAEAVAEIAGGFDGYVARRRDKEIASFEDRLARGYYTPGVVTWCGRLDLAQKEANSRAGRYLRVWIVEAELDDPVPELRTVFAHKWVGGV